MVTFKMTIEKSFCSFARSNRLYGIWLAGANWNEFHRTTQLEDINVISVPLICQEIMKVMKQPSITENVPSKKKNKKTISLVELSHLAIGIVKVFEYQVKFLYDQVLQRLVQQSKWDLDFSQPSVVSSLNAEKNQSQLSTNKTKQSLKRKRNASSDNQPLRTKVRRVSFHWSMVDIMDEEAQDVEADNEITMKVLQTSIVMNKNEITMREVEDDRPDPFIQVSQFEATDHSTMQFFHEISKLAARRLSSDRGKALHQQNFHEQPFMADPFNQRSNSKNSNKKSEKNHRNENLVNTNVEEQEEDEDEYDADESQQDSLPDISMYRPIEEHIEPARENDDKYKTDQQRNHSTVMVDNSVHSLPDISIYQPELNENICYDDNAARDSEIQVDAPISNVPMLNVPNGHNGHHSFVPVQNTSQAVVKVSSRKRKREFKDTILQVDFNKDYKRNTLRCSKARRDVVSKADFLLKHYSELFVQPLHMLKYNLNLLICPERFVLKHTEETDFNIVNDFLGYGSELTNNALIKPNSMIQRNEAAIEREIQPIRDKDDSATNIYENESPMLAPDVSVQIKHPCVELSNFVEPAPVEEILNGQNALDLMPLIEPPNEFHLELPQQILKVLNLSDSANVSDTHWSTDSEKTLMLKNQKNRREWGVKGVMEHLFWMWNNNIYPIGMKELTQSCESRVAKALAFHSILELNSPRIGLISIENMPNSNNIYNIAKSEKLNDLLQSIW